MEKKFLNEELNRMMYLFGHKRGVVLSEQKLMSNLKSSDDVATDEQAVEKLQQEINDLRETMQREILNQLQFKFKSGNNNGIIFDLYKDAKVVGSLNLKPTPSKPNVFQQSLNEILLGKVSIYPFLGDVLKNKTYLELFRKYPKVEEQVKTAKIDCNILPATEGSPIIVQTTVISDKKIAKKSDYSGSDFIPFGDLVVTYGGKGLPIKMSKTDVLVFEITNTSLKLGLFAISNVSSGGSDSATEPKPTVITKKFQSDNSEPFKYDKVEFFDDEIANAKIDKFVEEIRDVKNMLGNDIFNEYIKFLKEKPIEVITYSSRDRNPKDIINGKYAPCSKPNQTAEDYNLCLSKARAERIATIFNEKLPELGNFVGVGKGETDKFGPSWKEGQSKQPSNSETLPNRRYEITLPEFQVTIPVKTDLIKNKAVTK